MRKPKVNKVTHVVTFSCKHTKIFGEVPPKVGEKVWCTRCDKPVTVESAPPEWKIRCQTCGYGRSYGTYQGSAEIAAAQHRIRNPGHEISLMNGNRIFRFYGNDGNQTVIGLFSESDRNSSENL